jgi:protein tyrosine phosphatase (PTP) superfamily phosphohydrolase (DUF442 family)
MRRRPRLALVVAVVLSCACGGDTVPGKDRDPGGKRPENWAEAIDGGEDLPNLFKVDEGFYRGAQPRNDGIQRLQEMGIRTVVSFRTSHSDRKESERSGLDYVRLPMRPWDVDEEEVIEFLSVATDPERRPVFVHCYHGSDRTGMMTAVYRVVAQGWSKDEAIDEMRNGGFGFHRSFQNMIDYIEDLDPDALATAARVPR